MTITGPDVSKYQAVVDFAAVARAGHSFAVVKATEGVGYTSPTFAAQRAGAHAAGLVVGLYHFGRFGPAEADYFLSVVGQLQPGEFLVLDQEVPSSVAWCKAWLDAVSARAGVRPLIYMNQSSSTGLGMGDWSAVAASYGLWLARYDGTQVQPSVPYWGAPAMKQFTDRATVPGVAGTCDLNVFFGSRDQLLAYGTPTGGDVPLTDADITKIMDWPFASMPDGSVVNFGNFLKLIASQTGAVAGKVVDAKYPYSDREGGKGPDADDMLGQILSTRAALADLARAVAQVQAPAIDEAKLAAALLANPDAVNALGRAIADNLQLTSRPAPPTA